ncbi:hypothetical protein [Streptomyces sp. NPDC001054]
MPDTLAAYRLLVAAAQRITAERVTYGLVTPEAERAYDHALTDVRLTNTRGAMGEGKGAFGAGERQASPRREDG